MKRQPKPPPSPARIARKAKNLARKIRRRQRDAERLIQEAQHDRDVEHAIRDGIVDDLIKGGGA